MPNITRNGLLIILSSPSGAGKTTLSRRLLEADPNVAFS
ncbi:MAG: guanylate kinase, partial [Pseudomonadota bacterium]